MILLMLRKALDYWFFPFIIGMCLIYSHSFSGFPSLSERVDLLADADSASFEVLIKDFHLSKKYGNEYASNQRSILDIAQKHKIHHLLYVLAGSSIYKILSISYSLFGVSASNPAFAVNAIISCANIYLIYLLLIHFNHGIKKIIPMVILYAFSLTTWVYASVLDSWPFTVTLILVFLYLNYVLKLRPILLAVFVGIFMLNNIILMALSIFIVFSLQNRYGVTWKTFYHVSIMYGIVSTAWASGMLILSFYDPSMDPIHYFQYTIWFKQYVRFELSYLDPYVWKIVLSNLFINTFTSNQPDPFIPPESLLYTIKGSYLGIVSASFVVITLVTCSYDALVHIRNRVRDGMTVEEMFHSRTFPMALFCSAIIIGTVLFYPPSTFLYSLTIVPFIIFMMAKYYDTVNLKRYVLLCVTVVLLIVNNTSQVMSFRSSLKHDNKSTYSIIK